METAPMHHNKLRSLLKAQLSARIGKTASIDLFWCLQNNAYFEPPSWGKPPCRPKAGLSACCHFVSLAQIAKDFDQIIRSAACFDVYP
jgi:hypothetical protein